MVSAPVFRKDRSSTTVNIPLCGTLPIEIWIFVFLSPRHILPLAQNTSSIFLHRGKLQPSGRLHNPGSRHNLRVRLTNPAFLLTYDTNHQPRNSYSTLPLNDQKVAMRNGARYHRLHASPPDYIIWTITLLEAQSEGCAI